ncbi:MAG: tyrosine-type recombinase/integrase [Sporomusaceae bacterium]|nr:tyrosine-type recombinase/integrase [Sporomusaceae bacterium]
MSVQKKGDAYYAVIMYRDEFGKKKYKWINLDTTSQRKAERLERQIRSDFERGALSFAEKVTVDKYLNRWLETSIKPPNRRNSTYENYKCIVDNINKNLGHILFDKLKPFEIQEHLTRELERGLKPTSVKLQYSILNEACKKAVRWKILQDNPCEGVDPPEKNKPNSGAYTPSQVDILLDIFQKTPFYLGILLGTLCGLRRGEICGLRWEDINLEDRKAHIRHSLDRMAVEEAKKVEKNDPDNYVVYWDSRHKETSKTVLVLGPVKTDESDGAIKFPKLVAKELKNAQLSQKLHAQQLGKAYRKTDLVFCWETGIPYDPDYFYKNYKKIIKKYNKEVMEDGDIPKDEKEQHLLPELRLHDLRHTFATILLHKKIDTKIVSKSIRHKRSSFTADIYQHVTKELESEVANTMDDMFGEETNKEGLENRLEIVKKA